MMEVNQAPEVEADPSTSAPPSTPSPKAQSLRLSSSRLSVETYLEDYTSTTKPLRLKYIFSTFSNLRDETLELLASELKKGLRVDMLAELSQVACMVNSPSAYDDEWARKVQQERRRGIAAAESNLSHAKSSSNKESIRRAFVEMGDLLVEHGELLEAIKCYQRTRDYFGKPEHSVETYSKIAICHIDLGRNNYINAEHAVMKIDVPLTPPLKAQIMSIQGLLSMLAGRYSRAAREFLDIDGAALNKDNISNVITIADIGLYSCLCALATLDLGDIKRLVLDSKKCKLILEQSPEMRSMVEAFCSSNYGEFLRLLAVKQADMQLDMHLNGHLEGLLDMISDRVLIQYCRPYATLDLQRMASALNKDITVLESDLAKLIAKGDIKFRIDSAQHQLHRKVQNEHDTAYEKVTALAEMHASSIRQGILRLSLQQHNFSVMPEQTGTGTGKSQGGKEKKSRRNETGSGDSFDNIDTGCMNVDQNLDYDSEDEKNSPASTSNANIYDVDADDLDAAEGGRGRVQGRVDTEW